MNKSGPIVIIDDDSDDQETLKEIFKELKIKNEISSFNLPSKALEYLKQTHIKPFMIISDINMPEINGFELRELIRKDSALENRCIPYLFISTDTSEASVVQAYLHSIQGIFQKPVSYNKWKEMIRAIVEYWNYGMSPNAC
jgi:CheY-like chemotaxis protein